MSVNSFVRGLLVATGLAAGWSMPGLAQNVYVVNTTANTSDAAPGDGMCADAGGDCSLLAAIEESNATVGTRDSIHFNIPGTGPHTIRPTTEFPNLTGSVIIDGYSQPGASHNTNPFASGSNAVFQIELDGSDVTTLLILDADSTVVRGLVFNRYNGIALFVRSSEVAIEGNLIGTDVTGTVAMGSANNGIQVGNGTTNLRIGGLTPDARNVVSGNFVGIQLLTFPSIAGIVIQGNYVGTDITGTVALPNQRDGISLHLGTVGGTQPGAANLLSGNGAHGVRVGNGPVVIQGNLIGTDATGTMPLGNDSAGVAVLGGSGNTVGGSAPGAANTIAFNGTAGVVVGDTNVGAQPNGALISRNSIHSNGGLGIDLASNGLTINDTGDGDTGPNDLQNFPVLTMAYVGGAEGIVNSMPNTTLSLEFFASTGCDASGHGEGTTYVGSGTVGTDGSGNGTFVIRFPAPAPLGQVLTATAADPGNNTSEFSSCVPILAQPMYLVTSADDVDDGMCNASHCSLREAILAANANPGANDIGFDIPGTGPHSIQLMNDLPPITESAVIDGYTQPGAGPNTNPLAMGSNASVMLEVINVNPATQGVGRGFDVQAPNVTVRGFAVSGFTDGVWSGSPGTVVEGSRFDTDVTGLVPSPIGSGLLLSGGASRLGGDTPAQRNIVGGRVAITGNGNVVQGNLIGVDASGQLALRYSINQVLTGHLLLSSSDSSQVGGTGADAGNVVAGGLRLQDAYDNVVQGNYVGTDATGTIDFDNPDAGINSPSVGGARNVIGGTGAGEGNVIAFNDGPGVRWVTMSESPILGNSIYANGGLGIDLSPNSTGDGVTPNDVGDADTGPNQLQNFPVLSAVLLGDSAALIEGSLNSMAMTTYRLEFFSNPTCHASGNGEGKRFLGFADVMTDGAGDVSFDAGINDTATVGQAIAATATDPDGNTSEFSACVAAVGYTASAQPVAGPAVRGGSVDYAVTVKSQGGTFDRDLALACTGLPTGASCTFAPDTVNPGADSALSTLTVLTTDPDTPTGALSFGVAAASGVLNQTAAATLTVTDFTVDLSPDSVSVTAGQTASYSVTIAPDGPTFGDSVALSCTGLPQGASCSFSPAAAVPGAGGVVSNLTVTTASVQSRAWPSPRDPGLPLWMLAGVVGVALLGSWSGASRRSRRYVLAFAVLVAVAGLGSCASKEVVGPPGRSPVTTTFTVTGTSGNLVHSVAATVTVR